MFKKFFIIGVFLCLYAEFALAQTRTFRTFVSTVIDLMLAAIPVVMALAFVAFLWNGVMLVWGGGDIEIALSDGKKGKTQRKNKLFWSVIALFVMVVLWGIVQLLKVTFLPA